LDRINPGSAIPGLGGFNLTIALLIIVIAVTALAPLLIKKVNDNLEPFLFVMGLAASLVSGALTAENLGEIFTNRLLYIITGAVLVVSFLFRVFEDRVGGFVDFLLEHMPIKLVVFLLIVGLGFLSSVITAIVASLLLTEFLSLLPLDRKSKVRLAIIACFSIGLGAVLTPVGEPLSTVVVSRLHGPFTYMIDLLGVYVVIGVLLMGILGTFFANGNLRGSGDSEAIYIPERETSVKILLRAAKIFIFVVGLDLLGNGFKPIIDAYVIHWNDTCLYFANLLSAILDNATLAAAEISPEMTEKQITAILMGLLISGGMLITGNIPNIVTAGKLKITMKEWAVFALPIGAVLLVGYYIAIFVF
jgi:Predicted cation transporter